MNYNNCNCTNILSNAFSLQEENQNLATTSKKHNECFTNNLNYIHSFYLPINYKKKFINSSTQTYELINEPNLSNYDCGCNSKLFHYNCQYYKETLILPQVTTATTTTMPLCLNCNCYNQQQKHNQLTTKNYNELKGTNASLFNLCNTQLCCNNINNVDLYSPKINYLLQNQLNNINCNDSNEYLNLNNTINNQKNYQGETFVMNERSFYI